MDRRHRAQAKFVVAELDDDTPLDEVVVDHAVVALVVVRASAAGRVGGKHGRRVGRRHHGETRRAEDGRGVHRRGGAQGSDDAGHLGIGGDSLARRSPARGRTLLVEGFDRNEVSVYRPDLVDRDLDGRLEDPGHGRHGRIGQYRADLDRLAGFDLDRAEGFRLGATAAGQRCAHRHGEQLAQVGLLSRHAARPAAPGPGNAQAGDVDLGITPAFADPHRRQRRMGRAGRSGLLFASCGNRPGRPRCAGGRRTRRRPPPCRPARCRSYCRFAPKPPAIPSL